MTLQLCCESFLFYSAFISILFDIIIIIICAINDFILKFAAY
jgi:hypothetical protein